MTRLTDWLRWSRSGDRELDEEIRTHLEIEAERLATEEGLSPEAAREAARRRFGNLTLAREDSRAVWGFGPLDSWIQDARFGLRLLARSPLFTLVALFSLALGIGATIASFSLLNNVLLRPLPVTSPDRLVLMRWVSSNRGEMLASSVNGWLDLDEGGLRTSTSFSHPAYVQMRGGQRSFTGLVAFSGIDQLMVRRGSDSDISSGQFVSGNYFRELGVAIEAGRAIGEEDDRPGADGVGVISYTGWQRRFGGSADVIGARVSLNGVPFTIIGVAPRGFNGCLQVGADPEFSIPLSLMPRLSPSLSLDDPGYWWLQVLGRLKPGASFDRAVKDLGLIFDRHVRTVPAPAGAQVALPKLQGLPGSHGLPERRRELERPLAMVAALVALVLLVACASVASLMLARATARTREVALRMALGAGRMRLMRQMITESVMLGLLAGIAGVVLAAWLVPLLFAAAQPRASDMFSLAFDLDRKVLAFAFALSSATGVALGLVAMWRGTRADVSVAVREKAGVLGRGKGQLRLGKVLVVAQIAMSLLLLVLAGLFTATLRNLGDVKTGIDPENLLLFRLEPALQGYEDAQLTGLYSRLMERIRVVPGVSGVALARHPLFMNSASISTVTVPGRSGPVKGLPNFGGTPVAWSHMVGGTYLETLRIPLVAGRQLAERDQRPSAAPAAMVNLKFARAFWRTEQEAIGRTVVTEKGEPPVEVVGVVGDAKYHDLRAEAPPTIYLPFARHAAMMGAAYIYVRTTLAADGMMKAIRRAAFDVDPKLSILQLSTQQEQIRLATGPERRLALTAVFFGLLTVALACIGLYGVIAYGVSRRTGEIGVRLAMGASPSRVVREVLGEATYVVVAGVLVGVGAAVAATRLVRSQLFGLEPTDPATIAAAVIVVSGVALAAGYLPARRASRVDPLVALRSE